MLEKFDTAVLAFRTDDKAKAGLARATERWRWADARIDGDSVLVSNSEIPAPVSVRYAWADNPEGCNLRNGEDLPASPFNAVAR